MHNRHVDTQKKIAAVRSVASKLHAAELAIDQAIIKLSELNSELPAARIQANLSATVCQSAFDLSAGALQSLIVCRGQTIKAHEELAQTQIDIGLGVIAMGDGWKIFKSSNQNLAMRLVKPIAA
jgi:hypothetical protein